MSRFVTSVEVDVLSQLDIDGHEIPRYIRRNSKDFVKIDSIEAYYPKPTWDLRDFDFFKVLIRGRPFYLFSSQNDDCEGSGTRQWRVFRNPPMVS